MTTIYVQMVHFECCSAAPGEGVCETRVWQSRQHFMRYVERKGLWTKDEALVDLIHEMANQ